MAKKLNSIFRKKYTEKKFNKKLLGKLFLDDEKKALLSIFKYENGIYCPLEEINEPKKIGEINRIAKTIRKNSGALGIGKTGALAVITVLIILFSIFLKNPLAERGLEKALESVFRAEAEIDSLSLKLLRGEISFSGMRVADKDNLERNLFETGRAEIDIDIAQALKGKFDAENVELEYLSLDTKRGKPAAGIQSSVKSGEKDNLLSSLKMEEINKETVRKAIEENLENLKTLNTAEEIRIFNQEAKKDIENDIKEGKENLSKLEKAVKKITDTKIKSVLDIQKIKTLSSDIKSTVKTADNLNSNITKTREQIGEVSERAAKDKKRIEKAILDDTVFIAGKFNTGILANPAESIKNLISESLSPFLGKFGKAVILAAKIKGEKSDETEKIKRARRGRDIKFPLTGSKPGFLIEKIGGSFVEGEKTFKMKVESITNNADLIGKPLTFSLEYENKAEKTGISGFFDSREKRDKNGFIRIEIQAIPFSITDRVPGIESAEGICRVTSEISAPVSGGISGNARISTSEYSLKKTEDAAGTAVSSILKNNRPLEFNIDFKGGDKDPVFKINSSLDKLFKDAVDPAALSEENMRTVKSGINDFFSSKLSENEKLKNEISALSGELEKITEGINNEKKKLNDRLSDIPSKLR